MRFKRTKGEGMRFDIDEIFERYKDHIFAIGFNYFKNSIDADDVVQEVFYKLYKSSKDFESEDHLRNWLIRVAINECKRVTLSSWFKKKEPLEDYAKTLVWNDPEESEVFLAVMNLPKKYRTSIHLYYYENYSIKEIAGLLGMSSTAVSTQLLRGRKKLKEKLLEVWKDE